ncbi:MAG: hypothetical protein HQL84_17335 [Magnetococcales bacterium]|nr:hypothetical protein [Magnetococcales bacterium]MBF0151782.1 hypothetical protein [Magnetococcales bacterium]MBF0632733.1 hypothetical protein [Magnetococcales bacterium]
MLAKLKFLHHLQILFVAVTVPVLVVLTVALLATESLTDKLQQLGREDLPLSRILADVAREQLGQSLKFNEVLLHARTGNREKFEIANDSFIQYGKRISDTLLEGRNIAQRGLEQNNDPARIREIDAIKTTFKEVEKLHGDYEHLGASLIRNIYQYEFLLRPELMHSGDHLAIEEEAAKQVELTAKSLSALEDETVRLENRIKEGVEQVEGLSQTLAVDTARNRMTIYKVLVLSVFLMLVGVFSLGLIVERIHEKRKGIQEARIREFIGRVDAAVQKMIPAAKKMEQVGTDFLERQVQRGHRVNKMVHFLGQVHKTIEGNIASVKKSHESHEHEKGLVRNVEKRVLTLDHESVEALVASRETMKIIRMLKNRLLQINMLTTNATAEATRNEATRGFAVFTDELREHARKSADETELVAELLEHHLGKVQNDTETMKGIRQGLDELTDRATYSGRIILDLKEPNERQLQQMEEIRVLLDGADLSLKQEKPVLDELLHSLNLLRLQLGTLHEASEQWPEFTGNRDAVPPGRQSLS